MKWWALLWMVVLVCLLTSSAAAENEHVETTEILIESDPVQIHEEPPENFIIITDVAASNNALIDSYPSLSYIRHAYRVVPVEEVVLSSSEVTMTGSGGDMVIIRDDASEVALETGVVFSSASSLTETVPVEEIVLSSSKVTMTEDSGDMVIIRKNAPEVAVETKVVYSPGSGMTEAVPVYTMINREEVSRSSAPVYYAQKVPDGTRHHWVDLDWGEAEQDLSLSVWHPSGLLGTFKDADDGRKNGRIFLRISDEEGVESGTWYYRVSGPRIPVPLDYNFKTYVG